MARQPKKTSDFDVRLGNVIRAKRTKIRMSQNELADASGIAMSNLQRRENGKIEITVSEIKRIAEALGVPAHELVDEALKDFGGMDKLIAEHVGVSEAPVSLDAHRQRNRTPADMTEEEWEELDSAANTDPEIGLDQPEQP